jgi:hypothetical protein
MVKEGDENELIIKHIKKSENQEIKYETCARKEKNLTCRQAYHWNGQKKRSNKWMQFSSNTRSLIVA